MEHTVFPLPQGPRAARELLDELYAQGWRFVIAVGERVIMCRKAQTPDVPIEEPTSD